MTLAAGGASRPAPGVTATMPPVPHGHISDKGTARPVAGHNRAAPH